MKEKMTNHGVCDSSMNRRSALKGIATAITPLIVPINGQAAVKPALPLGLDGHAMRGMKWKSLQHIEYAAKLKLDAVLFNGPHYFEALTDSHLKKVKMAADAAGLRIYMGIGGISEGAKSYKATFGNGADTLRQGIRMAKLLGSPVINCRIGNIDDRYSEGGIKARLAEAARSLKAVANEVRDAGLKCAFENHAGDTRSEEILELIDTVGSDVLGVMIDPGNAVWALEDPMLHLQRLAPHVACSSVRDYMVWNSPEGAMFQWTAVGEGQMDVAKYAQTMREKAPGVPMFVESISNSARPIPYLTPEFWDGYPNLKATQMIDFMKLCQQGRALQIQVPPSGMTKKAFDQLHQKSEFENSIRFLRDLAAKG